jgi:hypothetical protein
MIIKAIYAVVRVSLLMGTREVLTGAVFRRLLFLIGLKSNYNKIENNVQQRAMVDYYNICFFHYL